MDEERDILTGMKRLQRYIWLMISVIPFGLFGTGFGRIIRESIGLEIQGSQYRVVEAQKYLRSLSEIPDILWIPLAVCVGLILWFFGYRIVRGQHRRNAAFKAAIPASSVLVGAVLLFVTHEPFSRVERFRLVAALGFATAGYATSWSIMYLWPIFRRDAWRPSGRVVWIISLAYYVFIGAWMSVVQEPTGDEPHYLLGMHSIAYDGDLDVGNNHQNQDYRYFYPEPIHHAQMIETTRGVTLPKHSIGLMLIGAPFYALGGRFMVSILCSLVTAGVAICVYYLIRYHSGRSTALRCWAAVLLAVPLSIYPGQIYPNAFTAFLLAWALILGERSLGSITSGVLLGLIPWFHLGTFPLALGGMLLIVIHHRRPVMRTGGIAWFFWLALAAFNIYFWGALTPPIQTYGEFSFTAIPATLAGLFLDQEVGVLWYAPIWLLIIPGTIITKRRPVSSPYILLYLGWIVYISSFSWWYGGWSPVGRFLLPCLPLMSIAIAIVLGRSVNTGRLLWCAGGIASICLVSFPFIRFNAHDGSSALLDTLGPFGSAISSLLPRIVNAEPLPWIVWFIILGISTWLYLRRHGHAHSRS